MSDERQASRRLFEQRQPPLPQASEMPTTDGGVEVAFVGWDGGAIGNHQMLFARNGSSGVPLLLDPTVGLAARATFDQIASGCPISRQVLLAINPKDELSGSRAHLAAAHGEGAFRPSDLLYYFCALII